MRLAWSAAVILAAGPALADPCQCDQPWSSPPTTSRPGVAPSDGGVPDGGGAGVTCDPAAPAPFLAPTNVQVLVSWPGVDPTAIAFEDGAGADVPFTAVPIGLAHQRLLQPTAPLTAG